MISKQPISDSPCNCDEWQTFVPLEMTREWSAVAVSDSFSNKFSFFMRSSIFQFAFSSLPKFFWWAMARAIPSTRPLVGVMNNFHCKMWCDNQVDFSALHRTTVMEAVKRRRNLHSCCVCVYELDEIRALPHPSHFSPSQTFRLSKEILSTLPDPLKVL